MNKPNKTYKLGKLNNFNVSFSTVNKYQNNSFYLMIKSWVYPTIELNDYKYYLNQLKNKIKTIIHDYINEMFYNNFILDFNVTYNNMQYRKKSFMNIEITFYPKYFIAIDDHKLNNFFYNLGNEITDKLNQNNNFNFSVNKIN